jgi:Leucine-rich repeat (LRR) protein
LVLADWWEENGSESQRARAELIRVQVEVARLPEGDTRRAGLNFRQNQLLARHAAEWLPGLPKLDGVTWAQDFVRGFVEEAFLDSPGAFWRHAAELFAAAPLLKVRFLGVSGHVLELLQRGGRHLKRLRELDLGSNPLAEVELRLLADSPNLANLTTLLLHQTSMGDGGAAVLATARHLARLEELYLSGNGLSDRGVDSLARSPRFPSLQLLDLRDNRVGSAGLRSLAVSPHLGNLTSLFLVNNAIDATGVASLASARVVRLSHLTTLWLGHNPIGDEGALSLAEDPARANLRNLDLQSCRLRDTGGRALADSPYLAGLDRLWLKDNAFSAATLELLRDRFAERLRS